MAGIRNEENVIGILGISTDITELKNAQFEAEQANQAKSYVLGLITEELFQPYLWIIQSANLCDLQARVQDKRDRLDEIIQYAKDGQEMIQHAVESAEITLQSTKNFSPTWFDLKILFESNLSRQMDWALKRNIHLVLDYPDNTPMWVYLPRYNINLILNNMMNIAISESLRDRLEIKVNLIKKSLENMDVEISILPSGEPLEIERTLLGQDTARALIKASQDKQINLILFNIQKYAEMLKGEIKVTEKSSDGLRFFLTLNVPIDTVHPYAQSPWKAFQPDTRVLIVDSEGKGDVIRQHLGEKNIDVILNHEDIKLKLLTAEKEHHPYHIVMIGRVGKGDLQSSRAAKIERDVRKIRVKESPMLALLMDNKELTDWQHNQSRAYDAIIHSQLLPTELQKELAIAYERWLDMPKRAN